MLLLLARVTAESSNAAVKKHTHQNFVQQKPTPEPVKNYTTETCSSTSLWQRMSLAPSVLQYCVLSLKPTAQPHCCCCCWCCCQDTTAGQLRSSSRLLSLLLLALPCLLLLAASIRQQLQYICCGHYACRALIWVHHIHTVDASTVCVHARHGG